MNVLTAVPRSRPRGRVAQQASHAHLSRDVSTGPAPAADSRRGHVDAIIVPASRPARCLQPAIDLSVRLRTQLVVLCSKRANLDEVTRQVAATTGARALLVTIPPGWSHPEFPGRTSAAAFRSAQAGRSTDLSTKRNIGLALARLLGWDKVVFLDDDITWTASLGVLGAQLERHQAAGMVVRKHPDNSVVCHARRLAGLPQDVFVTGAVLGVRCSDVPLSFFPDVYNEDWFFFAKEVSARGLQQGGLAVQLPYDPFASPSRARHEEFGDLLAEGMFALFGERSASGSLDAALEGATIDYWSHFIEARFDVLDETARRLQSSPGVDRAGRKIRAALDSLDAAQHQLVETISPALCTEFISAWQDDRADWDAFTSGISNVARTRDALDLLQLPSWEEIGQSAAGRMSSRI